MAVKGQALVTSLYWLPVIENLRDELRQLKALDDGWNKAIHLAGSKLDFIQTNALDRLVQAKFLRRGSSDPELSPVRLAILGSSTTTHLAAGIRIAGLRRKTWVDVYEGEYGQYWQELLNPNSGLHEFNPTVILFALDGWHLSADIDGSMSSAEVKARNTALWERIRSCWQIATNELGAKVIQQTPIATQPRLIGNNEHRLSGSRASYLSRFNTDLRAMADEYGVDVLAIDWHVMRDGLSLWHDPVLWLRSKQEISPVAVPMFGELVARLLSAERGQSSKCLVLDLDNTLWGGVIGDDGLQGLVLGSGSALGEAFSAFQGFCRELARRGVILAICSKNDETNALEPFDKHPEMVLKRSDFSCFIANWDDKASNLRRIARELNIGMDALVFVDDNPFERALIRHALPMVAVPEMPEDPAGFAAALSDAGYFEAVVVTDEDRQRTAQYSGNRLREELKLSSASFTEYLQNLGMKLIWSRFDVVGLQRIVQLINKTNQFNLTTRRYTEEEVRQVMNDEHSVGLQFRLVDKLGDNGIIAIVIGNLTENADFVVDTWLMSCRVIGRQVEQATLNVLAREAQCRGAERIIGEYIPTAKNKMVADHFGNLGFGPIGGSSANASRYALELNRFSPIDTVIEIEEA
jgi:FkbH-like protein